MIGLCLLAVLAFFGIFFGSVIKFHNETHWKPVLKSKAWA